MPAQIIEPNAAPFAATAVDPVTLDLIDRKSVV